MDGHDYPHVMVDVETTGLRPDRNAVIQIAAVKFNLEKREISSDVFDQCLRVPSTRAWDEGTRDWWMGPKKIGTLKEILARGRPAAEVTREFGAWAGHGSIFWGKPATFDYMFVSSYFHDYEIANPFDFRQVQDMWPYLRGRGTADVADIGIDFRGTPHNALHDALHQVRVLFNGTA